MTARSRMRHALTVEPLPRQRRRGIDGDAVRQPRRAVDLTDLVNLLPWVLAIIVARLLGKGLAVFATARPSGLAWRQAAALTLALQPMSSLSVLLVADTFGWRAQLPGADGNVIQALLVATTLMQLTGPLWTLLPLKYVVREADETQN